MTVNIKFSSNQEFQLDAISAVVDLFDSQQISGSHGTASSISKSEEALFQEVFFSNQLSLGMEELKANLISVQNRTRILSNGTVQEVIPLEYRATDFNGEGPLEFSVEMETGTGKTYVYIRTILELYIKYGLSKFVIVVPTIAIREGVLSTLRLTADHFKELYSGLQFDAYVYDSKNVNKLRQFATSSHLQILIMNIAAFNRDENIIMRETDGLNGRAPIDFVQAVKPVVILDEPQKLSSELSAKAIATLNPIFRLRYSATHPNYINLVYRLSPVDAYEMRLVKKIDVLSLQVEPNLNEAFVEIVKITAKSNSVSATVLVSKSGKLTQIHLKRNDDLEILTESNMYSGWIVEDIHIASESSSGFIEFTNGQVIWEGFTNDKSKEFLHRAQIRATIQDHFETELLLKRKSDLGEILPTKALTLFFIDKVDNYIHDDSILRVIFENEYLNVSRIRKFRNLIIPEAKQAHRGYFASSKSGYRDSKEGKSSKEDEQAYDLIMKSKEKLLSLDEPVRFIFSHSALGEGWDNPNVFTLCSLQDTKSQVKRRQQIGRGLRLPVMASGERCQDDEVNHLTVIATESFEKFASSLQKEMQEEAGVDFIRKVQDKRARVEVVPKAEFWDLPGFMELWESISTRTIYRLDFESKPLIEECIRRFKNFPSLRLPVLRVSKHEIDRINSIEGIVQGAGQSHEIANLTPKVDIPDFLSELSNITPMSRSSIAQVVAGSGRLQELVLNPREFIAQLKASIFGALASTIKDSSGIEYSPIRDSKPLKWSMEFLSTRIAMAYQDSLVQVKKSIYEKFPVDSEIERQFALDLDKRDDVELFFKLPGWFKIDTPVGGYNPDWAIVRTGEENGKSVYLVRETKGTTNLDELFREAEVWKVVFGGEHFKAIGVDYKMVKKASDLDKDEYVVLPGPQWHGDRTESRDE
jgi:type III restriction enzyme